MACWSFRNQRDWFLISGIMKSCLVIIILDNNLTE